MILSTPGLMLHTTPYAETSVVAKVFTRQLGVKSYLVKGVRGRGGRVKQNLFTPLSSLDMVVYDSHRGDLNYVKELSPRHPARPSEPVANALRFFMTEVLYKALREDEPMPALWDYVEATDARLSAPDVQHATLPPLFMLQMARHLGIEPLDNYSHRYPIFDLQEGRFVAVPTETTLPAALSALLHEYLSPHAPLSATHSGRARRDLLDALLAYYQLHLSGFRNIHSHEILHTILN